MNIERHTWTDSRYPRPVAYVVLEAEDAPAVYIAPTDARDGGNEHYSNAAMCEVGDIRMTRADLREWATEILKELDS